MSEDVGGYFFTTAVAVAQNVTFDKAEKMLSKNDDKDFTILKKQTEL
jgi:hypothetical protein